MHGNMNIKFDNETVLAVYWAVTYFNNSETLFCQTKQHVSCNNYKTDISI